MIWDFRTHKVYCCKFFFNASFVCAYCCVYSIVCFGLGFLQVLQMGNVTTLTSSLWSNVECKGMWGQENVFENENHFHKCEIVQKNESNDSQVHSHFESCIHVWIPNIQNFIWKGKQTPNWSLRYHWKGIEV